VNRRAWPLRFGPFGLLSLGAFAISATTVLLLTFMIGPLDAYVSKPHPAGLDPGIALLRGLRHVGLPLGDGAIFYTTPLAYAILPLTLWFAISLTMMLRGWRAEA
jgi:hypothetical protein